MFDVYVSTKVGVSLHFCIFFLYLLIFVGNAKIKTENAQRRLGVFQGTKKDLGGTGG